MESNSQLPAETIHSILENCELSDLLAVSRVNTIYRTVAERLIYQTVVIDDEMDNTQVISCLRTLASASCKACLVRTFIANFYNLRSQSIDASILTGIVSALPMMSGLERLTLYMPKGEEIEQILAHTLKINKFTLTSLHLSFYSLDVCDWIREQKSLSRVTFCCPSDFGHHPRDHPSYRDALSRIQSLVQGRAGDEPLSLCSTKRYDHFFETIHVYPTFSPHWSIANIHDSLRDDCLVYTRLLTDMKLYIENVDAQPPISQVISSISTYFPSIFTLWIMVKSPSDQNYPESLLAALSKMPNLTGLYFRSWDHDNNIHGGPTAAEVISMAKSWAAACPNLSIITLLSGEQVPLYEYREWRRR